MKLNKRQLKIIKDLSNGLTNAQIAEQDKISAAYVQNILCNLYQLTETKNKHHLVAWAYQNKIL